MIICFSGTGNSLLVARQLQSHLGGDILMLEGRRLIEPDSELIRVPEGEPVVWVMPVYSWGIPPVVVPFLRRSKLKITPEHSTTPTISGQKSSGAEGGTPADPFPS